jgi:hypothetical protein
VLEQLDSSHRCFAPLQACLLAAAVSCMWKAEACRAAGAVAQRLCCCCWRWLLACGAGPVYGVCCQLSCASDSVRLADSGGCCFCVQAPNWLSKLGVVKKELVDEADRARPDVPELAAGYVYLQVGSIYRCWGGGRGGGGKVCTRTDGHARRWACTCVGQRYGLSNAAK